MMVKKFLRESRGKGFESVVRESKEVRVDKVFIAILRIEEVQGVFIGLCHHVFNMEQACRSDASVA